MKPLFEFDTVVPEFMSHFTKDAESIWNSKKNIAENKTLIIAPSGSGKTSLLYFITGHKFNYKGNILYNSEPLRNFSLARWSKFRKHEAAIIFQDIRLMDHLTVMENLNLKNNLTGYKSKTEIEILCEKLGLKDFLNKKCKTLSLGQQQRVGIVRSLLQPLRFLIADEPFSHLDHENVKRAVKVITDELTSQESQLILLSLEENYDIPFNKILHL